MAMNSERLVKNGHVGCRDVAERWVSSVGDMWDVCNVCKVWNMWKCMTM